jgi:protease I
MATKKVLFIIAFNGFQQTEYSVPRKIFLDAGFDVVTASSRLGVAIAKDGSSAQINSTIQDIQGADYDAVIFIGGPGALELDTATSHALIQDAYHAHIPLGAICLAARIFAHSGVLKGKHATGWDGDNALAGIFESHEITYDRTSPVVVDGKIVTATGPVAAESFGKELLRIVKKEK